MRQARRTSFVPPVLLHGPPEECYYTDVFEIPALYRRSFGKGSVVWFPWSIGAHHDCRGHLVPRLEAWEIILLLPQLP